MSSDSEWNSFTDLSSSSDEDIIIISSYIYIGHIGLICSTQHDVT